MVGATSALPRRRAIASALAVTRTLCLPIAIWGPFCSVPPVGMMMVVFPAAIRSRTSSQVSLSKKTVSGICAEAVPVRQSSTMATTYRIMTTLSLWTGNRDQDGHAIFRPHRSGDVTLAGQVFGQFDAAGPNLNRLSSGQYQFCV